MAAEEHKLEYLNKIEDNAINFEKDPNNLANVSVNIIAELNPEENMCKDEHIPDKIKVRSLSVYETSIYKEINQIEKSKDKKTLEHARTLYQVQPNANHLQNLKSTLLSLEQEILSCQYKNCFREIDYKLEALDAKLRFHLDRFN